MKLKTAIIALCVMLILLSGCAIDGETLSITPRTVIPEEGTDDPTEKLEVSNYDELVAAILSLITHHVEEGQITVYGYIGDVKGDVLRAIYEIQKYDPLAAFAVYEITEEIRRIVTYYEIDIRIEYRRTRRETEAIISIQSFSELEYEIFYSMREYRDEMIFRTSLGGITAQYIEELARNLYYQNPHQIVMAPVVFVYMFPENYQDDKIVELIFRHVDYASILRLNTQGLARSIEHIKGSADGENVVELLHSIADILIAAVEFDVGVARIISEHGAQDWTATAYGALINRNAVGEGFAMAFRVLCDALDIESRVVLGYLDGMVHAWNIVLIDGEYYHIDITMGTKTEELEYVFLRTEAEFLEMGYSWDENNIR